MKNVSLLSFFLATIASAPLIAQNSDSRYAADDLLSEAAQDFKLDGPEIYKVTNTTGDLMVEDFNGDGRLDIAAVANDKSLLKLFLQLEEPTEDGKLFEDRSVSLDRSIRWAVPFDVNGDERTDVLMAASPSKLVIMYQDDEGNLQSPSETVLKAEMLQVGDITGDDRNDVLVYNDKKITILEGTRNGLNLTPRESIYTTASPAGNLMILDVDGDGLKDIAYHNSQRFEEIVIRLQSPANDFPTEFRLKAPTLRSVAPVPADRRGDNASFVAIQNSTRELVHLAMTDVDDRPESASPIELSALQTLAMDPARRMDKPMTTIADIDGDGRRDLMMTSEDQPIIRLLKQSESGTLQAKTFPSLEGIVSISTLPVEKGEPTPLIFFSPEEQAVAFGVYNSETGQFPFPNILPVAGTPKGVAATRVEDKHRVYTLVEVDEEDESTTTIYSYPISGDGKLGDGEKVIDEETEAALDDLDVIGMEAMDANRDGRDDLIIYADFQPAKILLQDEEGNFAPLDATSGVLQGLLAATTPESIEQVYLDQDGEMPSMMAIKDGYTRAFTIDENNNVVVEQQFNGTDGSSRLSAVGVGSITDVDALDVVLLDRGNKVLTVYTWNDESWNFVTDIEVEDVLFTTIDLLDLDGDKRDDIVLTNEERISTIYATPLNGGLVTLSTIKTEVEDGGYGAIYTFDLLADSRPEVIAIEMAENLMEFMEIGEDKEDRPALLRFYQFLMFDRERSLARRVNLDTPPEPRELMTVDLNDDGKNEIVCIMHDNIVIYYPTTESE